MIISTHKTINTGGPSRKKLYSADSADSSNYSDNNLRGRFASIDEEKGRNSEAQPVKSDESEVVAQA